ncbi:MAG: DNA ligase D, partial [Gammaproteobacteria bacterium]|nr:DNA ligase D [Gammaproteobacteria bacterium]
MASKSSPEEALARYRSKRDFKQTPEPESDARPAASGGRARAAKAAKDAKPANGALSFVIQKHHARALHYDFRLELDGTLMSWAVPKGPCLDPKVKRMAIHVEDHPISYGSFEGTIPPGQYGAGTVIVWDRGEWTPVGDPHQGLAKGDLKFDLHGEKLRGRWVLVRMRSRDEKQEPWLLIKERDGEVRSLESYDVLEAEPDSVLSGKAVDDAPPIAPGEAAASGDPAAKKSGKASSKASPKAPAKASPATGRTRKAAASLPLDDAPEAELPSKLSPQLATLATSPPAASKDWLYELKFDGYRLLARIDGKRVQCFTRNGHDWTSKLPALAKALSMLPTRSAWLDGEIVVEGPKGAPDFQALQNAFDQGSTASIVYWLFDAPFLNGRDLRGLPVEQRRALLATLIGEEPPPALRFSETFDAPPRDLLASAAELGYEGLVGKLKGSGYTSRRSPNWIKLKNGQRQEFVIGGYTAPKGSRSGFGALLLGVHDGKALRYCGNVGTGFDERRLADIKARLDALATDQCPFDTRPAGVKAQWVRPELVAEVAFGEWTREGRVRHSVFHGLRTDKPAADVSHEKATPPDSSEASGAPARKRSTPARKAASTMNLRITHPERVIDKQSGVTKGELVAYYDRVSALILPHLKGRPASLVRAPDGVEGEQFFQKHAQHSELPG